MIQKNIAFPGWIGTNIALVAKGRRLRLADMHDQIIASWLEGSADIEDLGFDFEPSERISIYLSDATFEQLLERLVVELRKGTPGLNRARITESDLLRSALWSWLKEMDLTSPITPNEQ